MTENKIAIQTFMIEDTYISKSDLSKFVGINTVAISNNIEAMREKELCRVSLDKGGFWEIIEYERYFLGTKQHFLGYLEYFLGTIQFIGPLDIT